MNRIELIVVAASACHYLFLLFPLYNIDSVDGGVASGGGAGNRGGGVGAIPNGIPARMRVDGSGGILETIVSHVVGAAVAAAQGNSTGHADDSGTTGAYSMFIHNVSYNLFNNPSSSLLCFGHWRLTYTYYGYILISFVTAARVEVQTVALRFLQAAFCARIFRLLRLLQHIPALREVVLAMMRSTPIILRSLVLFGVVVFFWAIIGMELFGGYLSRESPCVLLRETAWWYV